jgi:hypothetical protein
MLNEIADCVRREESFAFETTLAGQAYVRHIQQWRMLGYRVNLYFLALPLAAVRRAAEQARQIAIQTNTAIVVVQNNVITRIPAKQLRKEARQKENT